MRLLRREKNIKVHGVEPKTYQKNKLLLRHVSGTPNSNTSFTRGKIYPVTVHEGPEGE